MTKHLLAFFACLFLFSACDEMQSPPPSSSSSSMLIMAPYQEPCLKWEDNYKTLINCMADRGFVVSEITEQAVNYNYYRQRQLTQTTRVVLDEEQRYVSASVTVMNYQVAQSQVKQWLSQQYQYITSSSEPAIEYFYRSKVATDSILVSLTFEDGHPTIRYDKGMVD